MNRLKYWLMNRWLKDSTPTVNVIVDEQKILHIDDLNKPQRGRLSINFKMKNGGEFVLNMTHMTLHYNFNFVGDDE
jgi:hypothetical protein